MRHLKRKRNLGMSPSHRSSLLSNLAASILDKERIVTTVAKAKEVRHVVERLITYGKKGGLHAIRLAGKIIRDKTLLKKLFSDIAPSFKEREGGYTRIVKLGERKGDNALMAIVELVGRGGEEIARKRKKKKKQQAAGAAPQSKEEAKSETVDKTTPAPEIKAPKTKKIKSESKAKEASKEASEEKKAEKTETAEPAETPKPSAAKKPAKAKKTKTDDKTDKKS